MNKSKQFKVLLDLINKHPDSYIKVLTEPPIYIPIICELFDFQYIRTIKNITSMKIEQYNNLPVYITCNEDEQTSMNIFINSMFTGTTPNMVDISVDDQLNYLLIILKIASTQEANDIIKNITFNKELYIILLNMDIDILNVFTREQRSQACRYIYNNVHKSSDMKFTEDQIHYLSNSLLKYECIYYSENAKTQHKQYEPEHKYMQGNWIFHYYRLYNDMYYTKTEICENDGCTKIKDLVILENPISLEYISKQCDTYRLKDIYLINEFSMIVGNKKEYFKTCVFWKPYTCWKHACKNDEYHRHYDDNDY